MKQILTAICVVITVINTSAQNTPFHKYDIPSVEMEHVFLDCVADHPCKLITIGGSQYLGQVDKEGNLYGYGRYLQADGTQIFGKFRNGQLVSGITLGRESALVGNSAFYSSYSLTSCQLEYVFLSNGKKLFDTATLGDYRFASMRYANGDQYVGEVYQDKRHGLGIYFYSNGDIWFGEYDNNARNGFGALFEQDNDLTIGQWEGEVPLRKIFVKRWNKRK